MGLCKEARKVRLKVKLDRDQTVGADGVAAFKNAPQFLNLDGTQAGKTSARPPPVCSFLKSQGCSQFWNSLVKLSHKHKHSHTSFPSSL